MPKKPLGGGDGRLYKPGAIALKSTGYLLRRGSGGGKGEVGLALNTIFNALLNSDGPEEN